MHAIEAVTRPHFADDSCWCRPTACCEECGLMIHNQVEVRPDNQVRMAVFSDQRVTVDV